MSLHELVSRSLKVLDRGYANFRELRKAEVQLRRISLPRTPVNSGSRSRAKCAIVRKVCAATKEESGGRVRRTSRRKDLVRGRGAGRAGRASARGILHQRNLGPAEG